MSSTQGSIRQAAVIAVRSGRVCLILSSSGRRWIIPKGHIELGQSAGETALQEAWEEAGLLGRLEPVPVGAYRYSKCGQSYHVTVFQMEVSKACRDWPESAWRLREWAMPEEVLLRIEEPGLRKLIQKVLAAELVDMATR